LQPGKSERSCFGCHRDTPSRFKAKYAALICMSSLFECDGHSGECAQHLGCWCRQSVASQSRPVAQYRRPAVPRRRP
jgi:hypothetical protein